ncbi:MAG: alpha-ketoacid dehydrogenase subunit beta [Phycisphaerae bacterium]|jgi:pyruvate dehydrogenase E1 component beta subunit|nr:alpha-ketoacid dehydrogenase subunit beta [Phycisphaerae bacterium]
MAQITYRDAINQALREEMKRDEAVIVFGEDVAQYEGSFKVTRGLLEEFGDRRALDTPISEAAIVGAATGAALGGLRPVPELMTVNFAYLAMDQIVNHLALMRYMFGGQAKFPVTIRMPSGGGHQLGSQHSHSLEVHFVHAPGLKVVYPATPADAKALLKAAIRDDNPVIYLEHEGLYNLKGEVPEEIEPAVIGKAAVLREGSDLTVVGYGAMTHVALEAAERLAGDGVSVEVVDLRTLRPWDKETVTDSVAKTHRAVVVEESPPTCGIGAEIAANIYEIVFDSLDAPVERVSGADVPLPYARELEQSCIPHADDVVGAARKALGL